MNDKQDVETLLTSMQSLAEDHEPEGWPAVQTKDITALMELIDKSIPSLDLMEARLRAGQRIEVGSNDNIQLVGLDGSVEASGKTLRQLMMQLIWLDC
jgi:hypothetical protein